MKKKTIFLGFVVMAVVFSIVFIGCSEPDAEDEWSPVTSLSQLNGRWKGSGSIILPLEYYLYETNRIIPDELSLIAVYIKFIEEWDLNIDVNAGFWNGNSNLIQELSGQGLTIEIWNWYKGRFGNEAIINESKKSITGSIFFTDDVQELLRQLDHILINQTGKKIIWRGGEYPTFKYLSKQ